jgi:hypothetical protein
MENPVDRGLMGMDLKGRGFIYYLHMFELLFVENNFLEGLWSYTEF